MKKTATFLTRTQRCLLFVMMLFMGLSSIVSCNYKSDEMQESQLTQSEIVTPTSDVEVRLAPALTSILYQHEIDYYAPEISVSQAFFIQGMEEKDAILVFFFSRDICVGALLWYGDIESKVQNMEEVQFFEKYLNKLSTVYQTQEKICVMCEGDNTICIAFEKSGKPIALCGEEGDLEGNLKIPTDAFEPIVLCPIYREAYLD